MRRSAVERRLRDISKRLKLLRNELGIADEQLAQLGDEADDARLRALVSETALAERDHREAARHAKAMADHRAKVQAEIEHLERDQDELLDRLAQG